MASFNRQNVMRRAWELFRATYHYPAIRFSSIGRDCFRYCLQKAWQEAREAARYAAIAPTVRAAQIERLNHALELAPYSDARNYSGRIDDIRQEISRLHAAA